MEKKYKMFFIYFGRCSLILSLRGKHRPTQFMGSVYCVDVRVRCCSAIPLVDAFQRYSGRMVETKLCVIPVLR